MPFQAKIFQDHSTICFFEKGKRGLENRLCRTFPVRLTVMQRAFAVGTAAAAVERNRSYRLLQTPSSDTTFSEA